MAGGAFAGLAGCNNGKGGNGGGGEGGHTHSYKGWHDNGDGTHSPECTSTTGTCDAPVKTSEKEDHDYGSGTTCIKCGATKPSGGEDTSTPLPAGNKIYLLGDSTVCAFEDTSYYMPRYGYGTQIEEYFNVTSSQVVNLAASGRSSYSLMTDPKSAANYTTFTTDIKAGDYLFIGFGHNDEKTEVARYADPTLASDDTSTMIGAYNAQRPVSFKYILKHYYIDVALAAEATPVLCTPVSRLFTDDKKSNYDSDHVTVTQTNVTDATAGVTTNWNGGDYAQAIRDLGEELGVTVVDMTTLTRTEYKSLGYAEASKYHAATGAKWTDDSKTKKEASGIDGTHTNLFGAKKNAYYLANAIKSSSIGLKNHVKTNVGKPTYADNAEACINAGYSIPEQKPFNPATDASTRWTSVTGSITDTTTTTEYKWYGTAFGNSLPIGNFGITQGTDSNGTTFTITADAGKGKIASDGDILAAVFIQLPKETAFTMTATANVETWGGSQSGFGIMLRDDIHIDKSMSVTSNYLSAGCYGSKSGANVNYWRMDGGLNKASTSSADMVGSHSLSLTRLSQNSTLKFDSYTHKMEEETYSIDVSDGEYVYLCLWATRGISVTFSNITFATTGWEQA